MIRQQPEGHDTFASGDSCFCAAKVAPVALSIITASVNWLSDKRYYCVRINHQIGPLSRTEQKSLWPQAVSGEQNIDKARWFGNNRRGITLLRRETPAFAQQKWSQWHFLSLRPLWIGSATSGITALESHSDRAIKSDKAKVLWPQAVDREILTYRIIFFHIFDSKKIEKNKNYS